MRTTLLLAPLLGLLASAKPESLSAYDRALGRAVDRSQQKLESGVELAADHSTWENAWRVSSKRFTIRTTESRYFGAALAADLESMYTRFQELTGSRYEPTEPLEVFVMLDLPAYNAFGNDHGAEHSSFYGSFFAAQHPERPVATYYSENPTLMRMWATHSAGHQFVVAAFGSEPPLPLAEGLATYWTFFWDWNWAVDEFERLEAAGSIVPLQRLLASDLDEFASSPEKGHARLVQLGMLFAYLLTFREDTRTVTKGIRVIEAPFRDYLRDVLAGRDASGHAVHSLLTSDLETLQRDFVAFDAWR
ncbi:MAG: hypothetical protein GY711_28455 [bacterium]|nr:hypothetical protein [bacterium]